MSYGSNGAVEEQERNQKWYTKKYTYCGENFKVIAEDYNEEFYCEDCKEKLYSKED